MLIDFLLEYKNETCLFCKTLEFCGLSFNEISNAEFGLNCNEWNTLKIK